MSNWYYAKFVAPVSQSLSIEVMVLGVFVVGISYIHCVMKNKEILKKGYLWRQIILLASVILFCLYNNISYNCETALHTIEEKKDILLSEKLFFCIMPIIDLSIIGIIGAMFGCLAIDSSLMTKEDYESSKEELSVLLVLSSTNHFVCILWWILWIGSETFDIRSICFHALIALIYLELFLVWRRFIRNSLYRGHKELYEWCGVAVYVVIVTYVYCVRMSYYFDSVSKFQTGR
ncbi:MAG: hypothetical protein D3904_04430 [Candidatus Electrothrix sp. EH2]|nr:hypothetical protein [Candidatus Electrothrix sp. EH2]